MSYLVDNIRLIQQIRELSPSFGRFMIRWFGFRNVFTLIANVTFIFAFIIQIYEQYGVNKEVSTKSFMYFISDDLIIYIHFKFIIMPRT